jgi:hypothetical protein
MMMETVRSSETLVSTYKSTRRYNPEDQHQHPASIYLPNICNRLEVRSRGMDMQRMHLSPQINSYRPVELTN